MHTLSHLCSIFLWDKIKMLPFKFGWGIKIRWYGMARILCCFLCIFRIHVSKHFWVIWEKPIFMFANVDQWSHRNHRIQLQQFTLRGWYTCTWVRLSLFSTPYCMHVCVCVGLFFLLSLLTVQINSGVLLIRIQNHLLFPRFKYILLFLIYVEKTIKHIMLLIYPQSSINW